MKVVNRIYAIEDDVRTFTHKGIILDVIRRNSKGIWISDFTQQSYPKASKWTAYVTENLKYFQTSALRRMKQAPLKSVGFSPR